MAYIIRYLNGTYMSSNPVVPENDGARFPLDSGLKVTSLVDMVVQELQEVFWIKISVHCTQVDSQ